jgi:hypothetical protein
MKYDRDAEAERARTREELRNRRQGNKAPTVVAVSGAAGDSLLLFNAGGATLINLGMI